ncbi:MAG: phosphomannomutase [Planctomycetes bacterium]|nr:phosphomannomutase [Planctomycetota bacterium]
MDETTDRLPCFKAYDLRGRVPDELDAGLAYRLGQLLADLRRPRKVVVGRDMRLSSPELAEALVDGLLSAGVDVVDVGLCGTEMVYFATAALEDEGVDAGVMVTASHNPSDFNGMKLVGRGSRPIHAGNGLDDLERALRHGRLVRRGVRGGVSRPEMLPRYVEHLLRIADRDALRGMTFVSNPGNGCAGPVVDALAHELDARFVRVHHEPDGRFPNGVPNPLLPENRGPTRDAVREHGADLGLAWDGDFDRCFLFDERGGFVEGYYVVGLLAGEMLRRHPGAAIVYEPRLTWNTIEQVVEAGGVPVLSRTGHAYVKDALRAHDAVYGGEMSAHHYFRDFAYCDTGMLPWLLVAGMMGRAGRPLSELVGQRMERFPCSGEINRTVADSARVLDGVRLAYAPDALSEDSTDGLSMEFERWRFNLRRSNTEPLIRLNVESRGDRELVESRTAELLDLIGFLGALDEARVPQASDASALDGDPVR